MIMNKPFSQILPCLILVASFLSTQSFAQFSTKATPIENISVKEGFKVELLFTVPKDRMGSWVNLCLDGKNRIIAPFAIRFELKVVARAPWPRSELSKHKELRIRAKYRRKVLR